ncbi:MAG: GNAT family N-acetyltransferase [Nanoarchaeota archaeon]|nr:GNAT family N-acetyltransferase [Nanoarchaeota archaeon]
MIKGWFEDPENNILFTSELRNLKEYNKIFFLMALKKKGNKYYTILIKENGKLQPVGFIALIDIDFGDKFGQIWYVMGNKNYRRRGLMSKALSFLLSKCKVELGLHSVHTWVVEDNIASIRVLEKNGFSKIGIQRESYYYNNKFKNRVLFDKVLRE